MAGYKSGKRYRFYVDEVRDFGKMTPNPNWKKAVDEFNFNKMECSTFVPKPDQNATNTSQLRCHCGDVLNKHAFVKQAKKCDMSNEDILQHLVHPEVHNYICGSIKTLPTCKWSEEEAFEVNPTDAYGKIIFKDGDKKPAKYVRVGVRDRVEDVLNFMITTWKILEPRKPELVIYVTGGAKNFKLSNKVTKRVHNALIKVADSTFAWLITSGFSVGLMKLVGEAVRDGQTFTVNDTNRAMHNIKCIGIGPWGGVMNSDTLIVNNKQMKNSFDGVYRTIYRKEKVSPKSYQPLPLDTNVTHFVFVDNGYRNRFTGPGSVSPFVMSFLDLLNNHKEYPMNLVTLLVNGGLSAFEDIALSVERNIPVVVCEGTERAADLFADAYWHSDEQGKLSNDYIEKRLKDKLSRIETNWHSEEDKEKCLNIVINCCSKKHLITIFDVRRDEDLDDCLLQAIMKGKKHSSDRYYHFNLAFACNKAEFAETELLKETIYFRKEYLREKLMEAIVTDKCDFVRLLMKQDLDLTTFLTRKRLSKLYNAALTHGGRSDHLHRLLNNCTNKKEEYTLGDIGKVLDMLIYRYDKSVYRNNVKTIDQHDGPHKPKINPAKLKTVRKKIFQPHLQESTESLTARGALESAHAEDEIPDRETSQSLNVWKKLTKEAESFDHVGTFSKLKEAEIDEVDDDVIESLRSQRAWKSLIEIEDGTDEPDGKLMEDDHDGQQSASSDGGALRRRSLPTEASVDMFTKLHRARSLEDVALSVPVKDIKGSDGEIHLEKSTNNDKEYIHATALIHASSVVDMGTSVEDKELGNAGIGSQKSVEHVESYTKDKDPIMDNVHEDKQPVVSSLKDKEADNEVLVKGASGDKVYNSAKKKKVPTATLR